MNVQMIIDPVAILNLALLVYIDWKQSRKRKKTILDSLDEIEVGGLKFKKGEDY